MLDIDVSALPPTPPAIQRFTEENKMKNVVSHRFWNSENNDYKGYKVYCGEYTNKKLGSNCMLLKNNKVRFTTAEEYDEIVHIYF